MTLTQITEKGIKDGEILNADINANAAIAGSKIADFVTGNTNNRVLTASGTANSFIGESALTFDGATLDINGGTTDTPLLLDTSNASGSHLRFRKDGANKHFFGCGGGFGLGDVDDLSLRTVDNIIFGVGTSEKMRINSSGNVGIGGIAPNYQLHVVNGIGVGAHGFAQQLSIGNNSIQSLLLGTGYTNLSLNALGGNVGVKTSSPIGTLDVHDGSFVLSKPNSSGNERNWRFLNNNVAAGNLGLQCSTTAGGSTFANVIEIKSNGKVGIGMTNPDDTLDVNGTFQVSSNAYVSGTLYALGNDIRIGGTGTGNSLDDYEEGTYVPVVKPSANASAFSYDSDYELRSPHTSGKTNTVGYTKIGNRVYLSFSLYFNTSGTSRVNISLPFAIKNNDYQCAGHCGYFTVAGAYGVTFIGQALSKIDIMENDSNGGHPDLSYAANTEIYFNFQYETN